MRPAVAEVHPTPRPSYTTLPDATESPFIALSPKGRIPEMLWVMEEVGERLSEILQRLLLHDTGPFGQPLMLGTGGG
jgi:hypothetical protein